MKVFYFAYGSNMDSSRLISRIGNYGAKYPAVLNGFELVFNKPDGFGGAYANIKKNPNKNVEGIVYEIDYKQLCKLDVFEGHPHHYTRKFFTIEINGQKFLSAVYVANKTKENLKPDAWYVRHLLAGQKFLSREYVQILLRVLDDVKFLSRRNEYELF